MGGTTYEVVLHGALSAQPEKIADTAGNILDLSGFATTNCVAGDPLVCAFTTESSPPTVAGWTAVQADGVTPIADPNDVPLDAGVRVSFDEPIDASTVFGLDVSLTPSLELTYPLPLACGGGRVHARGCVSIAADRMSAVFDPVEPRGLIGDLEYEATNFERYVADLDPTQVTDLGGTNLSYTRAALPGTFNDAYGFDPDDGAPVSVCWTPAVDVNGNVSVYFNEDVDAASFGTAFSLFDQVIGDDVAGALTTGDGAVQTFQPAAPLSAATTYEFVIDESLVDLDGPTALPATEVVHGEFTTP
jgi:hypothetical protein